MRDHTVATDDGVGVCANAADDASSAADFHVVQARKIVANRMRVEVSSASVLQAAASAERQLSTRAVELRGNSELQEIPYAFTNRSVSTKCVFAQSGFYRFLVWMKRQSKRCGSMSGEAGIVASSPDFLIFILSASKDGLQIHLVEAVWACLASFGAEFTELGEPCGVPADFPLKF